MASWDEPTGETEAIPDPPARRRSPVDQAITTLLVGALVITIAVGAFLFGRARTDASVISHSPASPSPSAVGAMPSSTDTTRRSHFDTTTPLDSAAPAGAPVASTPANGDAPSTTAHAPSTTQTTAPPTTAPPTTAPPTTPADTTP